MQSGLADGSQGRIAMPYLVTLDELLFQFIAVV
jgi:hypothetical protein